MRGVMNDKYGIRSLIMSAAFCVAPGLAYAQAQATSLGQPYPCSVEVSGNSSDCKAFGLGDFVNGCIKIDGVMSNDTTEGIQDLMVTVLVDKHVVANMHAASLIGTAKPGTKAPYSGASKYELSQALILNSRIYLDRPDTECLLSPLR